MCTMEYYSTIKKNEIMPLAATWTDQKIIILSEVNQKEKNKYCIISNMTRITYLRNRTDSQT